jgi:hypothetical protein
LKFSVLKDVPVRRFIGTHILLRTARTDMSKRKVDHATFVVEMHLALICLNGNQTPMSIAASERTVYLQFDQPVIKKE